MKATIYMVQERETKGTFRYAEVDTNGDLVDQDKVKIGTLYLKKQGITGTAPERLIVTIEGD